MHKTIGRAYVVGVLLILALPVVAAQEPGGEDEPVCRNSVFITNHYILQPAWVDMEMMVLNAFQPDEPSHDVLYWHGDLHFAGVWEAIEEIVECIVQKLESGGDVRACLYWPDWPV